MDGQFVCLFDLYEYEIKIQENLKLTMNPI